MRRACLPDIAAIFAPPLLAMPATAYAAADPSYGGLALSLLVVLGVFIVLAWVARRFLRAAGGQGTLKVVASLSMGARERVVVIELAGERLVLGVGGGQVNLLARLPAGAAPTRNTGEDEA